MTGHIRHSQVARWEAQCALTLERLLWREAVCSCRLVRSQAVVLLGQSGTPG
ncbi:MAG: hypothetical protein RMI91_09500 [Gemmatales bacterium]|nr:hypothetical protein [Gemmatales bacterium]MDW7994876.1 hypothetical protein [Gemmatales bacterium]